MLERARVTVDLAKITQNTRRVVDALGGIEVVGVTKVTCGDPAVASAMLDGGVVAIAESRHENAERLRAAGIDVPLWLLRSPPPSMAEQTVELFDVSLASEFSSVEALDAAVGRLGRAHAVVAMVDVGDLREGLLPADIPDFLESVDALHNVDLLGIGTSLTCYAGVVPSAENVGTLVTLAREAEEALERRLHVSGGQSSSIEAVVAGELPAYDGLRIGETILLGVSTVTRQRILDLHTDAITVEAPVIELKHKPSVPKGRIAQDAFGGVPDFADRGVRLRALVALGRQDVVPGGLVPTDPGVEVLGASSDHLILDVEAAGPLAIGDALMFVPDYAATLRLFTSPYVEKRYVGGTDADGGTEG